MGLLSLSFRNCEVEKSHFSQWKKGKGGACVRKLVFARERKGCLCAKSCQLLGSPTSGEFSVYIFRNFYMVFAGKHCARMTFCDRACSFDTGAWLEKEKKVQRRKRKKDPLK